jgi:hypothetical protein
MRTGVTVEVKTSDRQRLAAIVPDRNSPQKHACWANIVLLTADGCGTAEIMRRAGVSKTAVWRKHGLQPHRIRQFKLYSDPDFAAKLRAVVGLYVNPPEHAVVLSIDEKSQIQALDRTQPGLPLKKTAAAQWPTTKRHGTTTQFAALNILDGTIFGRCMQKHRHQEFIRFLNAVDTSVSAGRQIHAIVDNYATHKHPKVRAPG